MNSNVHGPLYVSKVVLLFMIVQQRPCEYGFGGGKVYETCTAQQLIDAITSMLWTINII
jgi:hypothetical protein